VVILNSHLAVINCYLIFINSSFTYKGNLYRGYAQVNPHLYSNAYLLFLAFINKITESCFIFLHVEMFFGEKKNMRI
jgi:hypothetical protein